MVSQSNKCIRSAENDFGAEDNEEAADCAAIDDTLTAFSDEMR